MTDPRPARIANARFANVLAANVQIDNPARKSPTRRPISHSFSTFVSLLLLGLFAFFPSSQAQMFALGSGGDSASPQVEKSEVRERALESFRQQLSHKVSKKGEEASGNNRVAALVREHVTEFNGELDQELERLTSDGLLIAGEVSESLQKLNESRIEEFVAGLNAIVEGHRPPPLARDYSAGTDYARELASYTLTERNRLRDWLMMIGSIIVALALAWGLHRLAKRSASRLAERDFSASSSLASALAGPLYLAALVTGLYIGLKFIWLPGVAIDKLDLAMAIGLCFAGFWFLWNASELTGQALTRFLESNYGMKVDSHVSTLLLMSLKLVIVAVAIGVVVRVILDVGFTSLLAGLGVVGVLIYLVLRGTFQNIAASFTIFGDEPFRVGDLIVYDDAYGNVENIGFRSTRFRTLTGHLYTIPNDKLIDQAIHNVSARPWIRRRFRIGLPYNTSPEKIEEAMTIIRELVCDHEHQPEDQQSHVVFEEFGAYELRIMVEYFFAPADYWKALAFDSEVNTQLVERFEAAGLEFAFPTTTNILETADREPRIHVDGELENQSSDEDEGESAAEHEEHQGQHSDAQRRPSHSADSDSES